MKAFQYQLKSCYSSSKGNPNTNLFLKPLTTLWILFHYPLGKCSQGLINFLRSTSASVCYTRWVSKPVCPEAQVQNDQGAMGFPAHAWSPSQATHRSWGSACATDVLRRLCKMKCSLLYHVQFENNSQSPFKWGIWFVSCPKETKLKSPNLSLYSLTHSSRHLSESLLQLTQRS